MKWVVVGFSVIVVFIVALVFFPVAPQRGELNTPDTATLDAILPKEKVEFLVFGDSGTGSGEQQELAKLMLDYNFDFILHTGDVAYDRGKPEELRKYFAEEYSEHLKKAKVYPSPGNHDYQTNALAPYLDYFNLPKVALNKRDDERYYSFDESNVHFISLDTNSPLNEISVAKYDDMSDWLEKDLESNSLKWKVIFFHHPPYSSGKEHGQDFRVQQKLVPVFEKHGVDLVLSGHEHNYERTCQVRNRTCEEGGITYLVTGGGGGPIYLFGESEWFTAFRAATHNFVRIEVDNCKLNGEAIGLDKRTIDKFELNKC